MIIIWNNKKCLHIYKNTFNYHFRIYIKEYILTHIIIILKSIYKFSYFIYEQFDFMVNEFIIFYLINIYLLFYKYFNLPVILMYGQQEK